MQPIRILLVDDEMELVSTMAERLTLRGLYADWATSAEEVFQRIETQVYDIAVLDVKIPKMSGFELKKKLQEKCPGMKFIFLTGHGSEADYRAGTAEAGETFYLVKPVKIEVLIEKIKQAVCEQGTVK